MFGNFGELLRDLPRRGVSQRADEIALSEGVVWATQDIRERHVVGGIFCGESIIGGVDRDIPLQDRKVRRVVSVPLED